VTPVYSIWGIIPGQFYEDTLNRDTDSSQKNIISHRISSHHSAL